MNEVVDVLIKESYVEDVTEDCNTHAHDILNVVLVDQFRDSAAINSSLIRYWNYFVTNQLVQLVIHFDWPKQTNLFSRKCT